MAPQVDYFLDDDDLKSAKTLGGYLLDVPSDAVVRGKQDDPNDDKYKATWVQEFEIVESSINNQDTAKDGNGNEYPATTFEVVFQVPGEAIRATTGEADPNAGRQHRAWIRMVPAAKGNPKHPKYKANNFALGKLLGVLRSIWGTEVIPPGTRPNLGEFFSGEAPAVVGKKVVAHMKQSRYNGEPRDEITDLIPLEKQEQ